MKSWTHHTAATLLGSLLFTAPALALSPEQQVQQGINQYNSGQYLTAIQAWESALRTYQQAQDYPRTTIVLENLARAYQQTGQGERELQHWDQLIATYTQLRDESQVGRSLTAKAKPKPRSPSSAAKTPTSNNALPAPPSPSPKKTTIVKQKLLPSVASAKPTDSVATT
jgi:tetratricopeptide (TPR) repeat protein